jgi:L-ascorbate metabolism protein UlaG (beta-lactamase superfamily)
MHSGLAHLVRLRHVAVTLVCADVAILVGCALPVQKLGAPPVGHDQAKYGKVLQVRFLGVAGFLIQRGDDVILTAPMYSNPDLPTELLGDIRPVPARIRKFHPAGAPSVDAILVGHAHYDHLMDVPYVWQLKPGAAIYGNRSMRSILTAYDGKPQDGFPEPVPNLGPATVVALDDPGDPLHFKVDTRNCAGQIPSKGRPGNECDPWQSQDGDWEYVKPTLRIRALCARHPPQFLCFHQAPGCYTAPLRLIPGHSDEYLEGRPLTYLIDFLDGPHGAPAFRVYFQDVPSDGPLGKVPEPVLADRRVDVALLCAGNWKQVENHDAESIVRNIRPQHVILGHWEDFFRPQDEPLEGAPLQDVGKYYKIVEQELGRLKCPEKPTLVMPRPQVLNVFQAQAVSCD